VKTHFWALLERAERGEEIVITRRGKAVAKIVPAKAVQHDVKAAQQALARIRKHAKNYGLKTFDWGEWKKDLEEGRP
jgi:prevent-host-death family protein